MLIKGNITEKLRTSQEFLNAVDRVAVLAKRGHVVRAEEGSHPLLSDSITLCVQWTKGGRPTVIEINDYPDEQVRNLMTLRYWKSVLYV